MKYENAKDILPEKLLAEVQKYAGGKLLYIPVENESKSWGEVSGYRQYYFGVQKNALLVAGMALEVIGLFAYILINKRVD